MKQKAKPNISNLTSPAHHRDMRKEERVCTKDRRVALLGKDIWEGTLFPLRKVEDQGSLLGIP